MYRRTVQRLSPTAKIPFHDPTTIPILCSASIPDGGQFPVRRVYCVGQNYAKHAQELGHTGPVNPFFFSKPADAVICSTDPIPYPPSTREWHHEVELVVGIGPLEDTRRKLINLTAIEAAETVYGVCVGLDMTRRCAQIEAKKAGMPWDLSKGCDFSAPIGPMMLFKDYVTTRKMKQAEENGKNDTKMNAAVRSIKEFLLSPASVTPEDNIKRKSADKKKSFDDTDLSEATLTAVNNMKFLESGSISLKNGSDIKQQGNFSEMILKVPELIALLSTFVELKPGDLLFTGTPVGVSSIAPGDTVYALVEGLPELVVRFGPQISNL